MISSAAAAFDISNVQVEKIVSAESHKFVLRNLHDQSLLSPWHDIPFSADDSDDTLLHFVCEIPKGTNAKYEIHKSEAHNPIIQDVKNGKPRFYNYGNSICNYGAIPQTWEDPNFVSEQTGFGGDNDPIDVLQINARPCTVGEVQVVRVLGTLALIDDGERATGRKKLGKERRQV